MCDFGSIINIVFKSSGYFSEKQYVMKFTRWFWGENKYENQIVVHEKKCEY